MPARRDVRTVDPDGQQIRTLPEGVVVRPLTTHTDDRGTVCELYDPRWGINGDPLVFSYMFTIRPGAAKGWGVHREHEDRYAFLTGALELVLYDDREDSPTRGLESRIFVDDHNRSAIVIPRGVWHAERNIGQTDVMVVNFPTIQYQHESPDKYRLPLDTDELPVDLGPGWAGW